MITIKTPEEIEILKQGGEILAKVLKQVSRAVKPGISTLELDQLAEKLILENGGKPSFKGYRGYPASICISPNKGVIHGIPSPEIIVEEGNVVGLDVGMEYQGLFTDMAMTVGVGKISKETKKLIKVTRKVLDLAIKEIKPGKQIGDLSAAIQEFVEKNGFSVVRQFAGHGVGRQVHEEPLIPNYGNYGQGEILKQGMVLAIEPMVNVGDWRVVTLDDGWTVVTADGSWSAHFEVTVAVTKDGAEVLTPL